MKQPFHDVDLEHLSILHYYVLRIFGSFLFLNAPVADETNLYFLPGQELTTKAVPKWILLSTLFESHTQFFVQVRLNYSRLTKGRVDRFLQVLLK